MGAKGGRGGPDQEEAVRDFVVMIMNFRFQSADVLQNIFLWMRYLYGSLKLTILEKQLNWDLDMEPGPDFDEEEEMFEAVDLHQDPWPTPPLLGPPLPEVTKTTTTRPVNFNECFGRHLLNELERYHQQPQVSPGQAISPLISGRGLRR